MGHKSNCKLLAVRLAGTILAGLAGLVSFAQADMVEYACVTEPREEAELSFAVPGRIIRILKKEGDVVAIGTPLIELDSLLEMLEVERRKLVLDDKSQLDAAKSQSEMLAQVLSSTTELYESTGSISREEMNKVDLDAKTAKAGYEGLISAEKRESVEYRFALANLDRRTLAAPFAGTIVDVRLHIGEITEANQPLVKLVDVSRGFLICNVEEAVGRRLIVGEQLPIAVQAGSTRWSSTGEVVFVAPVVDQASGLLHLKVAFSNDQHNVRLGMPGYVSIEAPAAALSSQ